MTEIFTDERWWVQRPFNYDKVEVFWVRYRYELIDEGRRLVDQLYYHDNTWHDFTDGEVIRPAISLNGLLLHYMKVEGNRDENVQWVAGLLQEAIDKNLLPASEEVKR